MEYWIKDRTFRIQYSSTPLLQYSEKYNAWNCVFKLPFINLMIENTINSFLVYHSSRGSSFQG